MHRKHLNKHSGKKQRACPAPGKKLVSGRTFAIGVCAGVLTSAVGISVACLAGVTALCGTAATAKLMAGAGAAGGVTSMTLKKKHSSKTVQETTNFQDIYPENEPVASED